MKRQRSFFPLVKPLEKGDLEPHLIGEGALMKAENVLVTERGRIEKRKGFTAIGGTANEKWLGTFRDRPIVFGDTIQVKDDASIRAGELDTVEDSMGFSTITSDAKIAKTGQQLYSPEMGHAGDFEVLTWVDAEAASNIQIEVRDRYSGHLVSNASAGGAVAGTYAGARVIPDSSQSRIYIVYVENSANIAVRSVNTSTGALSAETAFGPWPNVDSAVAMDAVLVDDGKIAIVYKENGANNTVVGRLVLSGDTVSDNDYVATAVPAGTGPHAVAIDKWATGEAAIVYHILNGGTRDVRVTSYDCSGAGAPSKPGTSGPDEVQVATSALGMFGVMCFVSSATQIEVWWIQGDAAGLFDTLVHRAYWVAAGVTTYGVKGGDGAFWCKPFKDSNDRIFYGVWFRQNHQASSVDDPQSSFFLLEDRGTAWPTPVGKWFIDIALPSLGDSFASQFVSTPVADGTDVWRVAGIEQGSDFYDSSFEQKTVAHAISINTTPSAIKALEAHNAMVMAGAAPSVFDGHRGMEMGFLTAPGDLDGTRAGGTSSWGSTGTLWFRAMYEVHDREGNRWMSTVSPASSVVLSNATDDVTVKVASCKHTRLIGGTGPSNYTTDVRVALYCIDAFGSTVYRRIAEKVNDPTSATVDFDQTDFTTFPDATEQEYTLDDYVLPNYQPPPFTVAAIWQNRLVVAHAQYPDRLIVFSKRFREGEGVFFGGTDLFLPVDPRGGDIVALAGMSDRLAILKRRTVMMTSGQGWDESGAGAGFQEPYVVADGIGCKNQASVIRTPAGVFFESDDCLYLLRPDYSLSPAGRSVRRVSDTMTIVGAALMPDYSQVVWFSTEGTTLVYNWLYNQWLTWTGLAANSCVSADGALFYRDTSTTLFYDDLTSFLDNASTAIVPTIETGWIAPSGLDECRVWEVRILGYNLDSDHTLTVKAAWDFAPHWSFSQTFDTSTLSNEFGPDDQFGSGLAASYEDGSLILKFTPGRRTRCTSVRFSISWSAT